jgi:hypothetical protein
MLSHRKGKAGAEKLDLKGQSEYAFACLESTTPCNYASLPGPGSFTFAGGRLPPPSATVFTTYHPLLVESHHAILFATLILGNFPSAVPRFTPTASLVVGPEGYHPVFLPPRSVAQADSVEVFER